MEAVIREHNYFPDAAARNLVGKQSKVLGLFIIDLAANHDEYTISRSQFFYDYIAFAIDITNRHGYNLLTHHRASRTTWTMWTVCFKAAVFPAAF